MRLLILPSQDKVRQLLLPVRPLLLPVVALLRVRLFCLPSLQHSIHFAERRMNSSASIKITPVPSPTKHRSASPSAAPISQTTHQRSRLSRQIIPVEESEPEAGGDDDMDADDDAEDERLYCFCQKQSYGDVSLLLP